MATPLWSVITRTVMPEVGLLTAMRPSLPPDNSITPLKTIIKHQHDQTIIINDQPIIINDQTIIINDQTLKAVLTSDSCNFQESYPMFNRAVKKEFTCFCDYDI